MDRRRALTTTATIRSRRWTSSWRSTSQVATHEELSSARAARSKKLWHLAIPDDAGTVKETKNFVIIGNVSEATLNDVATVAEAQASAVGRVFKVAEGKPLVKGRMTLFVCQKKYDYGEFGRMLEGHELNSNSAGSLQLRRGECLCHDRPAGQWRILAERFGGSANRRAVCGEPRIGAALVCGRRGRFGRPAAR